MHSKKKRQRELQLKKLLPQLLLLEKRKQGSQNYKLNLIEKLRRLRKLDSLMRKKSKSVSQLRLKS